MDDHEIGEVVQSMFTETTVFVAPEGDDQFHYLHLVCKMPDGTQPNMLFNAQSAVFLLDAVTRYMGTVFNVPEVGQSLNSMISEAVDKPIDWDEMPPPPEEPQDWYTDVEADDYRPDIEDIIKQGEDE